MYKKIIILLILSVTGVLAFPAAAQNPVKDAVMTEHALDGGYTLLVPDDWEMFQEEDGYHGYYFFNLDTIVYVLTRVELENVIQPAANATSEEVLQMLGESWLDEDATMEEINSIEGDDSLEIAYWDYTDEYNDGNPREGTWYVLKLEDDSFAYLDIYGDPGVVFDEQTDLVMDIVLSLTAPKESVVADSGETEACRITASEANSIQLRVGPGTNRSVFAFLPAGSDFVVTGQAEANDGSVWYQLDKAEVAPNAGAAEAWVAQDDVDTTGDCEAVTDADAPPIVPIQQAAPPAANPDNSGSSASTAGGNVPSAGNWRLSFGSEFVGSCAGTQTVRVSAVEMGLDTSGQSSFLSVNGGGASITFGGAALNRTAPGRYSGTFNFDRNTNGILSLNVVSSTQMVGRVDVNLALDDGTRCSIGIDAFANRN